MSHRPPSQEQWRPLGLAFGFGSHLMVGCMGCGFTRSWVPYDRVEGFRVLREALDHVESCPKAPSPMIPTSVTMDPNGGPTAAYIMKKGHYGFVYEQHGETLPEGIDPATVLRP